MASAQVLFENNTRGDVSIVFRNIAACRSCMGKWQFTESLLFHLKGSAPLTFVCTYQEYISLDKIVWERAAGWNWKRQPQRQQLNGYIQQQNCQWLNKHESRANTNELSYIQTILLFEGGHRGDIFQRGMIGHKSYLQSHGRNPLGHKIMRSSCLFAECSWAGNGATLNVDKKVFEGFQWHTNADKPEKIWY